MHQQVTDHIFSPLTSVKMDSNYRSMGRYNMAYEHRTNFSWTHFSIKRVKATFVIILCDVTSPIFHPLVSRHLSGRWQDPIPAILHYIWDTNQQYYQDGPGNLLLALPRVLGDSHSRNCTPPYSPSKGIPYPLQMNNGCVDCIVNTVGCPVSLLISIGI